jgi:PIN domain nuclease of toxin-antitoxin system
VILLDTCAVLWLDSDRDRFPPAALRLKKWGESIVRRYALIAVPISRHIAVTAASLPWIHRDPFDRIIISTAKLQRLKVVTGDSVFTEDKDIQIIWQS